MTMSARSETSTAPPPGPAAFSWPAWPGLIDPELQQRLADAFSKLGVVVPASAAPLPSVADALLGRLAQTPSFAHLWDMDQKLAGLTGAWAQLHGANLRHQALLSRAWTAAQQGALQRSAQAAAAPHKSRADAASNAGSDAEAEWRRMLDEWLSGLNAELLALMRSDEYLGVQRQLLSAGLDLREQLRRVGQEMAELLQLPGRDEVDDLSRSLAELRRQVRQLTTAKKLQAGPTEPARPTPRRVPR